MHDVIHDLQSQVEIKHVRSLKNDDHVETDTNKSIPILVDTAIGQSVKKFFGFGKVQTKLTKPKPFSSLSQNYSLSYSLLYLPPMPTCYCTMKYHSTFQLLCFPILRMLR